MAYMLHERVAMEVVTAYRDRPDTETHAQLEAAERFRDWVETLPIDPAVRAVVVEPVAAVEAGLRETLRRRARDAAAERDTPAQRDTPAGHS
jgi:hypothetical protein